MLGYLTLAFTLLLVTVNLVGLALACARVVRSYALARVASPMALALVCFFVEHFLGLGRLTWVWPLTTAASVWFILRDWRVLRANWGVEAAYAAGFAWVLLWRLSFPDIIPSSEKIGDLAMIDSYLPGTALPPVDAWLPPYPFDMYYAFQQYAAALLGRIFSLSPGLTYNVAFCVLISLAITAAAVFAYRTTRSALATTLLVVAFAAGGTGASLPVRFMTASPQLFSSMRFIGGTARADRVTTAFGHALASTAAQTEGPVLELPSETFAYMLSLGDYHPPLAGFLLLVVALLCMVLAEQDDGAWAAQAVLAATPMVCAIANGWTLPLQAALVAMWVGYRLHDRRPPDWASLAGGFLLSAVLCQPFLARFASHAGDYGVSLQRVARGEHTPLVLGLVVLYPVILAGLLPLLTLPRARWIWWLSLTWLGLLLFSEVFYIDDVYSGTFNRFNTTLKWWPWLQAGALLSCGAWVYGAGGRALRTAMTAVLLLVSVYAWDMGHHLATVAKPGFGRMDGAGWITADKAEKVIYEFLQSQPRGIVLQRLDAGAYTRAPGLALLAGQRAFLGWPAHEKLWRGDRIDIDQRASEVSAFYAGTMTDSLAWLQGNGIDDVLWLKTEVEMPQGTFERIDAQIRGAYFWRDVYRVGEFRVGFWTRRSATASGR